MKVTRIFQSLDLTATKHGKLSEMASILGGIRSAVWNRFGSIAGVHKAHREIRDEWMQAGYIQGVHARLWKATLSDVIGDINAYCSAAIKKVKNARVKTFQIKTPETRYVVTVHTPLTNVIPAKAGIQGSMQRFYGVALDSKLSRE